MNQPVSNFTGWIKLIFDTVDLCNFVINEFNPTFEVQGSGNVSLQKNPVLKHPIFNALNFRGWIKLIYDTVDVCNFVISEFNPTFEAPNMGNTAFQNALFGNLSFPNRNEG